MYISKLPPIELDSGDILTPESLNENNQYYKKSLEYVANQQTARWTTCYSLVPSVSSPIVPGTSSYLYERYIPTTAFRARGGVTPSITIESVSVVAYYTATAAFQMNVGALGDQINFPIRDATLATTPYYVTKLFNITSTSEDLITFTNLTTSGCSITKLDVIVGFASDKYLCGNYTTALTKPSFNPADFNDSTSTDAATITTIQTSINTTSSTAIAGRPSMWTAADFVGPITSSSGIYLKAKSLSAWQAASLMTTRNPAPAYSGIYLKANVTNTGAAGNIAIGMVDKTGSFLSILASIPVGASYSGFINGGSVSLGTFIYNNADIVANDYYLYLNPSSATITINQATLYAILQ